MKIINFDDELAVEILKRGDVLAFPTETVFGLGVRYDKIGSFNKLVSIKRRPPDKPFTLMVGNKKMIYNFFCLFINISKLIYHLFISNH